MRTPLCAALGLLLLTSCGSEPPQITPQVREQLRADIAEVRSAALRHDRIASDAAVLTLTRDIAAAQARGELAPAYAHNLLVAAGRISEDAAEFPAAPPPPAVTITAPAPAQQVVVLPPPAAPPAPVPAPDDSSVPAGQVSGSAPPAGTPAPQATGTPEPAADPDGGGGNGKGEATKGQGE